MADLTQLPRALRIPGCFRPRSASSCNRLALQAMRNSPATQASSNCDVVMVCTRCPVLGSVFTDIAVRELMWKGMALAFMSVVLVVLEISDGPIVFFFPFFVFTNAYEVFGSVRMEV